MSPEEVVASENEGTLANTSQNGLVFTGTLFEHSARWGCFFSDKNQLVKVIFIIEVNDVQKRKAISTQLKSHLLKKAKSNYFRPIGAFSGEFYNSSTVYNLEQEKEKIILTYTELRFRREEVAAEKAEKARKTKLYADPNGDLNKF